MDFSLESIENLDFSVGSGAYIDFGMTTPSAIGVTPYEGEYTVMPTVDRQILQTNQKLMRNDVIIEPIPSNYGLITWNGSTLTVS